MKRPTMLVEALLVQLGRDLDLSVERDVLAIRRRCEHEGLSFLTITLPLLSDSLERGLEEGRFSCPANFCRHGSLPRLLGGFFNRVFARSGEVLPEACVESIFAIRQICRFFKKLKISCSPERELRAVEHYKEVERELGLLTPSIVGRKDEYLDKVASVVWSQVFPEIDTNEIVCQHGPGVTADRRRSNERYRLQYWYDRSELTFPSDLQAFSSYEWASSADGRSESGVSNELRFLGIRDEPGVRVVFVPKTQQTPRVIAIEPSSMQYIQQGLLKYTVPRLESHSLTRRSIRFSDQSVNQRLARSSSVDRRLATLDLKDASDRVHYALVQRIFKGSGILEFLEDSRSLHATLPTGDNVILNKFASMGSAMCFPVEAMVFYTIIQASMHRHDGKRPTSRSIRQYSDVIDIYGDDIIVPVEYTDSVVRDLETYGLKVNINKSFRSSLFRESCGGDYYNGVAVKPVYARQLLPDDARSWTPSHVMAWVSTSNQFYLLGMWSMAQAIRDMVEEVLRVPVPRSRQIVGDGIYFFSVCFTTGLRFNQSLYGWDQKRVVYQPSKKKDDIDGDAVSCLNKWGIVSQARGYRKSYRSNRSMCQRTLDPGSITPQFDEALRPSEGSLQRVSRTFDRTGSNPMLVSDICLDTHDVEFQLKEGAFSCLVTEKWQRFSADLTKSPHWELSSLIDGEAINQLSVSRSLPPGSFQSSRDSLWTLVEPWRPSDDLTVEGGTTGLDRFPLDFRSSVKRGGFKSKRRWVTLIT